VQDLNQPGTRIGKGREDAQIFRENPSRLM
jgi:hypothetical protein